MTSDLLHGKIIDTDQKKTEQGPDPTTSFGRYHSVRWRVVRLRFSASVKECTRIFVTETCPKRFTIYGEIIAPDVFGRVIFAVFGR